ncbi:DHH family phosphoesterase [uncultured Clostridium sp.]|uniref:DHH family phosphoesterase n=1 Tax=uncultured Clostridium sp. TaxID=59620 RepID=UPI002628ACBD|nr:DHH family phosphoesterase [uncultured Clostridium sp.]
MHKLWESIYSPNYISGYNPFNVKNMNKAIERLVAAINNREKILVYGGYDVDCISGISAFLLVLKYLNADVEYCIADITEDNNYDLKEESLKNDIAFLGAKLLITVGSGLENEKVEELCKERNIDLIVTENKKKKSFYNSIYINPSEEKSLYRYKDISQSGVVFKLMQAIAIYYNMKSINRYLDLILIGGLTKQIGYVGENRIILKEGVSYLDRTNNVGLIAIKKFHNIKELNGENIEKIISTLTPRNRAISEKDNAKIIVELLTTDDKDRAEQITKYLHNEKFRL